MTKSYAPLTISASCHRVPVVDGHLMTLSLSFKDKPTLEQIKDCLSHFQLQDIKGLPTCPDHLISVTENEDRPQPRLDRENGGGMSVTVGRIRPCPILDVKLTLLW